MVWIDRCVCNFLKILKIAAFRPKADAVNISMFEDIDTSFRKLGSALCGVEIGEFNDDISAVSDCCFSPFPFINDSGFSALYKIAAHDCNDCIGTAHFSGFLNLECMAVVKWIVFCNNSASMHKI